VLLIKTKKPQDKKTPVEVEITLKPELQETLQILKAINPQLLQALKHDEKPKVRLCALQALEKLGLVRSKIIPILAEADGKKDGETLLEIFLKKHDPMAGIVDDLKKPLDPQYAESKNYLQSLLEEKDVNFRRGAIEFLELLGSQAAPALPEVTQALRDENRFVRLGASRTIRQIRPKKVSDEAVLALAYNLLIDSDADVSAAAANAIAALGPAAKQAVNALGIVIANPGAENRSWDMENRVFDNRSWDAETRVKAMKALVSIGPSAHSAIPKVLTAMNDRDVRVRRQAAETLGLLGRPADPKLTQNEIDTLTQKEIDALRKALRDEDAGVRLSASEAILTITATK
jgi:HEAT repeat protein